jgi:hypothetical protein
MFRWRKNEGGVERWEGFEGLKGVKCLDISKFISFPQ